MARRLPSVLQADVARAIRAAKQAGAATVELKCGNDTTIVIRIAQAAQEQAKTLEDQEDFVL